MKTPLATMMFCCSLFGLLFAAGFHPAPVAAAPEDVQSKPSASAPIPWPPAREDIVNVYRDSALKAPGSHGIKLAFISDLPACVHGPIGYAVYCAPRDASLTVTDASAVTDVDCWWVDLGQFFGHETVSEPEEWTYEVKGFVRGWKHVSNGPSWSKDEQLPFSPRGGGEAVGWIIPPHHNLVLMPVEGDATIEAVSLLGYLSKR